MGRLEYVTGDLLEADLPAIAHGCNTVGVMGSGIARLIRHRWPERMFADYQKSCADGDFKLGSVQIYVDEYASERPVLFNLATQELPGPNANLVAIAISVLSMLNVAIIYNEMVDGSIDRIGIPRVGAGIGGLEWSDVEEVLEMVLANRVGGDIKLVVYTLPSEVEKFS